MNNHNAEVTVIIANWNGLTDTQNCLNSLIENTSIPVSIVVIDNGSSNNEAGKLKEQYGSKITLIENTNNLGFVAANNMALLSEQARNSDCLLLNNDTIVHSDLIKHLSLVSKKHPSAGIIGPTILNKDKTIQSAGAKVSLGIGSSKFYRKPLSRSEYNVDMVSGCCFFIKKEVIQNIGLLDPEYFAYFEETDYCIRAKKAGFSIIVTPRESITHLGGATSSKMGGFHEFQLMRNRLLFVAKNGDYIHRITLIAYCIGFYIPARIFLLSYMRSWNMIPSFIRGFFAGLHYLLLPRPKKYA